MAELTIQTPRGINDYIQQEVIFTEETVYKIGLRIRGEVHNSNGYGITLNIFTTAGVNILSKQFKNMSDFSDTVKWFSLSTRGTDYLPVEKGGHYIIQFKFGDAVNVFIPYNQTSDGVGKYQIDNEGWINLGGNFIVDADYEPPPEYEATITLLSPIGGAHTDVLPPEIQYRVQHNAPYVTCAARCTAWDEYGNAVNTATVPMVEVSDPEATITDYFDVLQPPEYTGNLYIEWHAYCRDPAGNLLYATDTETFYVGEGIPPPPPEYVTPEYFLTMLPDDYLDCAARYPVGGGIPGWWTQNGTFFFWHEDGYYIYLSKNLSHAEFWETSGGSSNAVTEIPRQIALDAIARYCDIYENRPPVPSFTWSPLYPGVNETVIFDGSASYDPEGAITSWIWEFGDGRTVAGPDNPIIEHAYQEPGSYTVRLTIEDNLGASASIEKTIAIGATPPPSILPALAALALALIGIVYIAKK